MFSPEERKILFADKDLQSSAEYSYLQNVARIRQKDAAHALGVASYTGLTVQDVINNPQLQVQNLISPEEFSRLGFTHPQVKAFLEDPIHMAIVRDRKSIDNLIALQDNSSYTTAAINGIKSIPRTLAAAIEGAYKTGDAYWQEGVDAISQTASGSFGGRGKEIWSNALGFLKSVDEAVNPLRQIDWETVRKSDILQRQDNEASTDRWGKQLVLNLIMRLFFMEECPTRFFLFPLVTFFCLMSL